MITPEQIRGARALLDWKISDLAERTGLTINGINKVERGHVSAQKDTLESIQQAFESNGVEFLPSSGVRRRSELVQVHVGVTSDTALAEDICLHLQQGGGELLILFADEELITTHLRILFSQQELVRRRRARISHKIVSREDGIKNDVVPSNFCRTIPSKYSAKTPLLMYGSKLALVAFEPVLKVIIVDNKDISESAIKLFNFVWDHAVADRKNSCSVRNRVGRQ